MSTIHGRIVDRHINFSNSTEIKFSRNLIFIFVSVENTFDVDNSEIKISTFVDTSEYYSGKYRYSDFTKGNFFEFQLQCSIIFY